MESSTDLFVRDNKAYVTSLGDGGYGLARIEPVEIIDMDMDQLAAALEKVRGGGIRQLAVPASLEVKHFDPLPPAVVAESGRQMDEDGLLYCVDWGQSATTIEVSHGESGHWEDVESFHFAADASCRVIAGTIMDDVQKRRSHQA